MIEEDLKKYKLLTREEVAKMLGVCKGTIGLWERENRMPFNPISMGGITRYRLSDIIEFIESNSGTKK